MLGVQREKKLGGSFFMALHGIKGGNCGWESLSSVLAGATVTALYGLESLGNDTLCSYHY